jgi:hypothetical protein
MREINLVVEIKNGKKWVKDTVFTDETLVYKYLANDLISKKLNGCTYIKTIKRVPNYDGTQTITVTFNNDIRSIYTVKN